MRVIGSGRCGGAALVAALLVTGSSQAIEWRQTEQPASEPTPEGYEAWAYTVSLNDGRVLHVRAPFLVQIYSPASGHWTKLPSPPSAIGARGHAVLLADGSVLFTGGGHGGNYGGAPGTDGAVTATQIFNPATNSWSIGGSLTSQHELGAAVALSNGNVLIAGGMLRTQEVVAGTSIYDRASGNWHAGPTMLHKRYMHVGFATPGGGVMVAGGGGVPDTELLPHPAAAWEPGPSLVWGASPKLVPLPHGDQLMVPSSGGSAVTNVQKYDASENAWVAAAPLSVPRNAPQVVSLANGCVLVAGGVWKEWCDIGTCPTPPDERSSELYDPVSDTWTPTVPEPGSVQLVALKNGNVLSTTGWVLELGGGGDACAAPCECRSGECTDGVCVAPPDSPDSGCAVSSRRGGRGWLALALALGIAMLRRQRRSRFE